MVSEAKWLGSGLCPRDSGFDSRRSPHTRVDKLAKSPVFETGILAGSKPASGAGTEAEVVDAPGCGPGVSGFESRLPPQSTKSFQRGVNGNAYGCYP